MLSVFDFVISEDVNASLVVLSFSYLMENISFFANKMTNLVLFECKIDKRFKIKKIVLTHSFESVECIPYSRGTR